MNLHEIIDFCLSKKGAFVDHPFGPTPDVIKVCSKMFALISDNSISLKCEPFLAQSLRHQYECVKPGYHLNKEHWNTINIDSSIPLSEVKWMIEHSYELVVKSLTKKEKCLLQEN